MPPSPTSLRSLSAFALYAAYGALGVALVGTLLWVARACFGEGLVFEGALSIVLALAVAAAWIPRRWLTAKEEGPERESLSPERFPKLHAFVRELAVRVGAPSPERVYLIDECAAFTWRRPWLGTWRRVTCLSIGLPLFGLLSKEQLGALIAHELAHAAGGAALLGAWAYRTRAAISNAAEALAGSPLHLPYRLFAALFLRVTGPLCRAQEFEADAIAAKACGREPLGTALESMYRLGVAWDTYFYSDLLPFVVGGARLPIFDGFERFEREPSRRADVEANLRAYSGDVGAPDASIPKCSERLAALGVPALPHPARAECFDLLGGPVAAESVWFQVGTRGEAKPVSWEELGPKLLLPRFREDFRDSAHPPATTPLGAAAELLKRGVFPWPEPRGEAARMSPEVRRRQLQRGWVAWLTVALVDRGYSLRLNPGAYYRLERDGVAVEPEPAVAGLLDGKLTDDAFRARVTGWERPAGARAS